MKIAQTVAVAMTLLGVSCVRPPAIRTFGPDANLKAGVEITEKSRVPLRLKITLPSEAQTAAFLVTPGEPTVLLYPTDSSGSTPLGTGVHDVGTIYSRPVRSDSVGLLRRPEPDTAGAGARNGGYGGNGGRGGTGGYGGNGGYGYGGARANPGADFGAQPYILVFTSKQPLSYDMLEDKVVGVTIPITEDEAFSTVTKLLHEATGNQGPWAATAIPFTPSSALRN